MAERQFSKALMAQLKKRGHATRIENITALGMPDVCYCINGVEGFIENKWLLAWPKNPERLVTLRHFTVQQRLWISERARAGGRVHVLLYVQTPVLEVFLFNGVWAAEHLGRTTRAHMYANASVCCKQRIDWSALISGLVDGPAGIRV